MNTHSKLSWKDVAYPHALIGNIAKMRDLSEALGYPMFYWNGRIYNTKDCSNTGTIMEEDVK